MRKHKEFELHETKKFPYFEGWYLRCSQEDISFAIILGIHKTREHTFAFVQFMDTITNCSIYEVFHEEQITYQEHPFCFKLDQNVFTKSYIFLHVANIQLELKLRCVTPLASNVYMPTIMGPFFYAPMQCSHSIISLRHDVIGSIKIGAVKKIVDGIGYMEKDRGISFPKQYLWFQANKLNKECCLFLSIASIPFGYLGFMGIIAVFMIQGKQYRFATYLGARIKEMKVDRHEDKLHVYLNIKQFKMCLQLHLVQHEVCSLQAPYHGTMKLKIHESLTSCGYMMIKKGDQLIYEEDFYNAGMEIVGFKTTGQT